MCREAILTVSNKLAKNKIFTNLKKSFFMLIITFICLKKGRRVRTVVQETVGDLWVSNLVYKDSIVKSEPELHHSDGGGAFTLFSSGIECCVHNLMFSINKFL
jgi:hypothetical protein